MKAGIIGNIEPQISINRKMGEIGIGLLTKAAICAGTIGVVAGLAAALFFRSE